MLLQTCLDLSLIVLLLLASVFDVCQRRIPNRLIAVGLAGAVLIHSAHGVWWALLATCTAGFAVGMLMFLPLYLLRGMAAGDVKLMAMVGTFVGPSMAFQASLATYICGGVLALAMVLFKRRGRVACANAFMLLQPLLMLVQGVRLALVDSPPASVGGMPYALAISAGTLLVLYLRHT